MITVYEINVEYTDSSDELVNRVHPKFVHKNIQKTREKNINKIIK